MMHIDASTGRIRPTRGSGPLGDDRRSWRGPTNMMRQYLDTLFSIAPEVVVKKAADKFFFRCFGVGPMHVLLSFIGTSPRTPEPVEVLSAEWPLRHHPEGWLLVLPVQGKRMARECWQLQRDGVFHFPHETGWPPSHPSERDNTGGYRLWYQGSTTGAA